MLNFTFSSQFKKDLRLLEKRRYDVDAIFEIVGKIIWEEPLPEESREHRLSGNWAGFTECHIDSKYLFRAGGIWGSGRGRMSLRAVCR